MTIDLDANLFLSSSAVCCSSLITISGLKVSDIFHSSSFAFVSSCPHPLQLSMMIHKID